MTGYAEGLFGFAGTVPIELRVTIQVSQRGPLSGSHVTYPKGSLL